MKIIAFGDIHEHTENIETIKGISDADCIIITGDITNFGGKDKAARIIDIIKGYNNQCLYAQPGNMDRKSVNDYLDKLNTNLHGNGFVIENVGIFGVGGSNSTPFKTPTEYSEKEIEKFLERGYAKVKHMPIKIMVPHAPPINTKVDMVGNGVHVGSMSVRKIIEKYQPQLCITGHIHEAKGSDKIGNTVIMNPGELKGGGYIEIIVENDHLEATLI